jgi:hypothetical protein
MGKFVIIPSHPSNDFFAQFPNCLTYATKEEFVGNLYYAMTHAPEPLTEVYAFALSWEAATQRLEAAGCIPNDEAEKMKEALSSEEAGIEVCSDGSVVVRDGLIAINDLSHIERCRLLSLLLSTVKKVARVFPWSSAIPVFSIVNSVQDYLKRYKKIKVREALSLEVESPTTLPVSNTLFWQSFQKQ